MTDFSFSQRLFGSHDTISPLLLKCVRVMSSVCKNLVFPTGVLMQAIKTVAAETINGAIEGWRPHDQKGPRTVLRGAVRTGERIQHQPGEAEDIGIVNGFLKIPVEGLADGMVGDQGQFVRAEQPVGDPGRDYARWHRARATQTHAQQPPISRFGRVSRWLPFGHCRIFQGLRRAVRPGGFPQAKLCLRVTNNLDRGYRSAQWHHAPEADLITSGNRRPNLRS